LLSKYVAANNDIRSFLAGEKRTTFIDVYHSMISANGQPMSKIFIADSLHMNEAGYEIWQRKIASILSRI
jgi:lysophospholipase L1-like esterase